MSATALLQAAHRLAPGDVAEGLDSRRASGKALRELELLFCRRQRGQDTPGEELDREESGERKAQRAERAETACFAHRLLAQRSRPLQVAARGERLLEQHAPFDPRQRRAVLSRRFLCSLVPQGLRRAELTRPEDRVGMAGRDL